MFDKLHANCSLKVSMNKSFNVLLKFEKSVIFSPTYYVLFVEIF